MPNARTRVRFRLEESVKKQAETIFARHGLTLAEAFRLFTEEAGRIGELPFGYSYLQYAEEKFRCSSTRVDICKLYSKSSRNARHSFLEQQALSPSNVLQRLNFGTDKNNGNLLEPRQILEVCRSSIGV